MEREIVESSIRDVTLRLWGESLSLGFCPLAQIAPEVLKQNCRGAAVEITGEWNGTVYLQVSNALAIHIAQHMFDLGSILPSEDQIEDCLKELTNITAGNLKTALPEPCFLSIPQPLRFESWDSLQDPFMTICFEVNLEPFRILLLKGR